MPDAIAALQAKSAELTAWLAAREPGGPDPIPSDLFHLDDAIAILRGGEVLRMRAQYWRGGSPSSAA